MCRKVDARDMMDTKKKNCYMHSNLSKFVLLVNRRGFKAFLIRRWLIHYVFYLNYYRYS